MLPRALLLTNVCFFVFLSLHASFSGAAEQGELVLRAVDIDTGEPIAGVRFGIGNSLAEDWHTNIGTTDSAGAVRLKTRTRRGYHYFIQPKPKNYTVVGLDDVFIPIVSGKQTSFTFKLRNRSYEDFPSIVKLEDESASHIPAPSPLNNNVHLESVISNMPGLEGVDIRFWFYPNKKKSVSSEQLKLAERIFANGKRVAAAVRDELVYFQKAVPEDRGKIDEMREIYIQIPHIESDSRLWNFWCRLPGGLDLRQKGYRITFKGLDRWNLQVPDYLQPGDYDFVLAELRDQSSTSSN